jgi:uncharacterized damage-inducible protein DinB
MPTHKPATLTTDDETGQAYLAEARQQLHDCHRKIRHCLEQLSDEQVWWRAGDDFNSIANLLLHLNGNVGQRILSLIGGLPRERNRAQEFAERGPIAKAELLSRFDETVHQADDVLAALPAARLLETRRYEMLAGEVEKTLLAIILHTLVHLGGHTQEIVALTRMQLRERYRFQLPAASPC